MFASIGGDDCRRRRLVRQERSRERVGGPMVCASVREGTNRMFRSAGTTPRRSAGLTGLPVALVEADLVTVTLVIAPELGTPHQ